MLIKRLSLILSFILFAAFVYFSYLVAKERFTQFDFNTTVKFQDHISRHWDLPFSIFSLIGSAEVTVLIWLGLFLFCLSCKYWKALLTLPLFFVSVAVEVFGKVFVLHPSPPHLFYRGVINFNFPSNFVHSEFSYPSGHLTRTAFLASFLLIFVSLKMPFILKLPLQAGLVGFMVLMMISRIYLGEHWTSDVVGGFLLGSSLGLFSASLIPLRKIIIPKLSS